MSATPVSIRVNVNCCIEIARANAGFVKGWVQGNPALGPMLKCLHRGPKGGGAPQTLAPHPYLDWYDMRNSKPSPAIDEQVDKGIRIKVMYEYIFLDRETFLI